jgi:hypothetical protein
MAKYRKRPVIVEAIQFDGKNFEELRKFTAKNFGIVAPIDAIDDPDIVAEVWDKLHSTWVGVKKDQWIIKGVQGEFYPCDPAVFEATYEKVIDENSITRS